MIIYNILQLVGTADVLQVDVVAVGDVTLQYINKERFGLMPQTVQVDNDETCEAPLYVQCRWMMMRQGRYCAHVYMGLY